MIAKSRAKFFPLPARKGMKRIYGSLPIQYRLGREFREMYAFLKESNLGIGKDCEPE